MNFDLDQLKKRFLLRDAGPFTAVDFTARTLHLAHATHRLGKVTLNSVETIEIPPDVDVLDPTVFGAFLGSKLRSGKQRSGSIVLGVPRGQSILKPIVLPAVMKESELAGMVMFQVEKELPFPADQAITDFAVGSHYDTEPSAKAEDSKLEVLVAAVKKPIIESYVALAKAARVKLLSIGLRPHGQVACFLKVRPVVEGECVALVHLTPNEVEINVIAGGALVMSRAATVKAPAHSPPATLVSTETEGVAPASPPSQVDTLTSEISRTLRSYQALQRDRKITAVYLTGDSGLEAALAAALAKRLTMKCDVFDVAQGLGLTEPTASGAAPAIGLALSFRNPAAMPFDFLHPKKPAPVRDDRRTRLILYGGAAAALVLFFMIVSMTILNSRQAKLDELHSQNMQLALDNKRVTALAKRVKAIEAWQDANFNWLDQWAMLSALFPGPVEAYITNLHANGDNSLSFTVKARNGQVITDLGKRLNDAGYDYRPGPVSTHEDKLGYTHTADVRLTMTPRLKIDLAKLTVQPRPGDDASLENLKPNPEGWGGSNASKTSNSSNNSTNNSNSSSSPGSSPGSSNASPTPQPTPQPTPTDPGTPPPPPKKHRRKRPPTPPPVDGQPAEVHP